MNAEVRRAPFYLGIDLGGTNIKAGLVDDEGRALSLVSLPTRPELGPGRGLDTLAEAGRLAIEASGLSRSEVRAVGLGSPGTMDLAAGLLLDPPNLPGWNDLPIRDRLEGRLGLPTILQNDGNAAAYGEFWAGAGRGTRSLVMLTLGTGVGGGIVLDGRVVEGRQSHGGECGHIVIQMDGGRTCSCGAVGHLEAYASATAIAERATEALADHPDSALAPLAKRRPLTSLDVDRAAKGGDPLAGRLMKETARYLAVGATNLLHTIDPDVLLLGGGVIATGRDFLDEVRAQIRRLAFPAPARGTRVDYAELGDSAGFIGAAGCARLAHPASPRPPAETVRPSSKPD